MSSEPRAPAPTGATVMCQNERCGWTGPLDECPPSYSPYHDIRCPDCGTTQVECAHDLGDYGKDNVLRDRRSHD